MRFQHFKRFNRQGSEGFALPMAIMFGFVMLTLIAASLLDAQSSRDSAQVRQTSGASDIVTDSAIARTLVELSKPENSDLLVRSYDPINPNTGENYLGIDGITNSGDETTTAVDEWTGYNPSTQSCYQEKGVSNPNMNLSGSIGTNANYRILAYRYNPALQEGAILIEGGYQEGKSHVLLTVSIHPDLDDFPGIGLIFPYSGYRAGVLALRGREILGEKANVYFVPGHSADPSITGRSEPGDSVNRASFLNAVWSSPSDGAPTDTVSGALIACDLRIQIPPGITGTNFGVINSSTTLRGVGGTVPTLYRLEGIDLSGSNVLTIDTTGGPVVIDMIDPGVTGRNITLRNTAKILNVRTDGQPPKVGDVRIMIRSDMLVQLYDQTCIQQVFLYSFRDELHLYTSGAGCPSGQNTNFEGVIWAEAILSSKNAASNRNVEYLGFPGQLYDTWAIPGVTSGIAVPDDVSSLVDLLQYTKYPIRYRYGEIKSWQRVRL